LETIWVFPFYLFIYLFICSSFSIVWPHSTFRNSDFSAIGFMLHVIINSIVGGEGEGEIKDFIVSE